MPDAHPPPAHPPRAVASCGAQLHLGGCLCPPSVALRSPHVCVHRASLWLWHLGAWWRVGQASLHRSQLAVQQATSWPQLAQALQATRWPHL